MGRLRTMAVIRPFCGLRFDRATGPLDDLIAPPYDVLSQAQRDAYAAKNAHNIVALTLPEQNPDDRSKFVKYARSSARLQEWRQSGAIKPEAQPAFYRYHQTFQIPGTRKTLTRTAIIALLKVEPYEKGVVLPHEQTFPKHKEDRLRILEATRAHLECIYGLFEDPDGAIHKMIVDAPAAETAQATDEEGVTQSLEPITDPVAIQKITEALADRKVWIADGHHRYETAVNFRAMAGEREGLIAEDFMMMALSSMSDPGLIILPTHRIVPKLPISIEEFDAKLRSVFEVHDVPNNDLMNRVESLAGSDTRTIGIALKGGVGKLVTLAATDAARRIPGDFSDELKSLDVSILHNIIFEQLLGLTGLEFFSYTRVLEEALDAVNAGADAAFLMNPPTVDDMRIIALGGEKMPQKSTYYYPKLMSGLVVWSLADF